MHKYNYMIQTKGYLGRTFSPVSSSFQQGTFNLTTEVYKVDY